MGADSRSDTEKVEIIKASNSLVLVDTKKSKQKSQDLTFIEACHHRVRPAFSCASARWMRLIICIKVNTTRIPPSAEKWSFYTLFYKTDSKCSLSPHGRHWCWTASCLFVLGALFKSCSPEELIPKRANNPEGIYEAVFPPHTRSLCPAASLQPCPTHTEQRHKQNFKCWKRQCLPWWNTSGAQRFFSFFLFFHRPAEQSVCVYQTAELLRSHTCSYVKSRDTFSGICRVWLLQIKKCQICERCQSLQRCSWHINTVSNLGQHLQISQVHHFHTSSWMGFGLSLTCLAELSAVCFL